MAQAKEAKGNDATRFAAGLGFFYAALFFGFGLYAPFFPVWLQAKGFDEATIGVLLAAALLVRLVATPVVTGLADRGGSLSAAIVICSMATAVSYIGLGFSDGFWLVLFVILVTGLFWSPVLPLGDAYGLAGVARRGLDYGRIRVWGSVAYGTANLLGGVFLSLFAPTYLVWFITLSLFVLVAAAILLVPDQRDVGDRPRNGLKPSFLDRRFVLVAVAAAVLQASHALYYSFSAIHWNGMGYSGATVGFLWSIGVIAEILLFLFAGRYTADWRPTSFLLIGGGIALVRWVVMAFEPGIALLVPLQVMHAATFGLVHLGTMAYLAQRLEPHVRASGQGMVSVAMGVVMAGATLAAGPLFARLGAPAYIGMAVLALLGFAMAAYARSLPRIMPQPQSEEAGG